MTALDGLLAKLNERRCYPAERIIRLLIAEAGLPVPVKVLFAEHVRDDVNQLVETITIGKEGSKLAIALDATMFFLPVVTHSD